MVSDVQFVSFRQNFRKELLKNVDSCVNTVESFVAPATIIHDVFCMADDCGFDAEEEELSNPWSGVEHQRWSKIWNDLQDAGFSIMHVLENVDGVFDLAESQGK